MSENSKIEWTDHTFNPWEGCQKVGPGCDHCYAETRNARFSGGAAVNWGPGAPRRRTSAPNWRKPLQWNAQWFFECRACRWRGARPANVNDVPACPNRHCASFDLVRARPRVFCSSLADVFDNAVPDEWRADLFELIWKTPNLDWLLLTKRIGNASQMISRALELSGRGINTPWPWSNVWLGATIVNQEEADRDIPKLLCTPARVHFLSMEPLLGPVNLPEVFLKPLHFDGRDHHYPDNAGMIDWVIVGGESGAGARPMHPTWPRALRDQCAAAGVPFLYKQWGEWTDEDWGERAGLRDTAGVLPNGDFLLATEGYVPPFDDGARLAAAGNVRLDGRMLMDRVGKKNAGRVLDGRTHDEFPRGAA
ncbi:phage Gp37/Gp68 family protein [Paraburkholderia tagetis]|uniref:Phage Gp37/Gp68 family protein n=1 Tax=Paraburkholderia tagetis TaxID=2913261 RepID=A0A9X1RLU4_9BURK|nr:phage Gp37/Gp68 family protein [Paraburkholderia tagetis]